MHACSVFTIIQLNFSIQLIELLIFSLGFSGLAISSSLLFYVLTFSSRLLLKTERISLPHLYQSQCQLRLMLHRHRRHTLSPSSRLLSDVPARWWMIKSCCRNSRHWCLRETRSRSMSAATSSAQV